MHTNNSLLVLMHVTRWQRHTIVVVAAAVVLASCGRPVERPDSEACHAIRVQRQLLTSHTIEYSRVFVTFIC